MKQSQVAVLLTACFLSAAVQAQAKEGAMTADRENDPVNAVVKLEVTTAKSDILCPWANRTDSSTGSGVVIDRGRILTC